MGKWFYEKNTELLEHPVNKTFEEILWMSEEEFQKWVADMRAAVVDLWDNKGIPPRVGYDEKEIIEQFNKISSFPVHKFLVDDDYAGTKKDVIRNTSVIGNAANQWFPTMMKTKINYTSDVKGGLSIYDHFKDDSLLPKMITYGRRHFKRDSFYHYSHPVPVRATDIKKYLYSFETGREWILQFEKNRATIGKDYDYWIAPKDEDAEYTGYDEKLRNKKWLTLTKDDLAELDIPELCKTNLSYDPEAKIFQIRVFAKGQKLFPAGLKAFRISVCQYAVNFPPLTAKFLYERYIRQLGVKEATIWDPSAGWGGRILGAMGVHDDFVVHYIGTDPNTDHNTENGRTKYAELADFYLTKTTRSSDNNLNHILGIGTSTYEIFQCGSEEMHKQAAFQKYKGKIDIVFTSPPYFAKELYSDDAEQSANKFSTYATWRDGFLRPTLKTAVEWLRPGGFILWNIADAKFGGEMLPLEKDSCDALEEFGMKKVEVLKMALAQMPGGNRIDPADGTPMAKNFCKVVDEGKNKEIWLKYEPIFVYRKI